jgi:hypothetical protein
MLELKKKIQMYKDPGRFMLPPRRESLSATSRTVIGIDNNCECLLQKLKPWSFLVLRDN